MKTIAIDCRFSGTPSGIGRYTRELAGRLATGNRGFHVTLLPRSTEEAWLKDLHRAEIVEADIPHYSLAEQTRLPSLLRGTKADLFFSLHFNVPWNCPLPFAATIHDLILHRFPNRASLARRIAYRALMRRCVSASKALVAVSPYVGKEIGETFGAAAAAKTTVIEEGVSPAFSPPLPEIVGKLLHAQGIDGPYFLYVGNAKEHKNVQTLIDAFAAAGLPDARLLLLTGGPEAERLRPATGVSFLRGVPDADLPALYAGARACVTASLYEGFCLPVAEALACGCPVIASNRTAIPDVLRAAREGVSLVEPTVDALVAAFRSPPARPSPVRLWDWDDTADRTAALLRSLL